MSETFTAASFYFCYNQELTYFLHNIKGHRYITMAKNCKTNATFYMFHRTELLNRHMEEFFNNK